MTVFLILLVVLLAGVVAALVTGRLGGASVAMTPAPTRSGADVLADAGVETDPSRADRAIAQDDSPAEQSLAPGEGAIGSAQVAAVRFDRAPRGYRMDQVDAVLDRLAVELARRDETIAALRAQSATQGVAWSQGCGPAERATSEPARDFSGDRADADPRS